MRVRKMYPGPAHPSAHNVFKFIERALVRIAPFEPSCGGARAFLSQALPALKTCKFDLKVLNLDPPHAATAASVDLYKSFVEVKLHDGSTHKFGTGMTAENMCKQLKQHASLNSVEPK